MEVNELTYKVRGADGKEYGPASLDQLNAWIRQGRLPASQEVRRSDMDYWAPAQAFEELQPQFASPTATAVMTAPPPVKAQVDPALAAQARASATWFYWVAGLSMINTVVALTGSSWHFVIGLGVTQILGMFGANFGGAGKGVVLVLNLLAAGLFVLFGVFGQKGQTWAFLVGMVLFGLDTVVCLLLQDWLGVAFHAFVLYRLFSGLRACRAARA